MKKLFISLFMAASALFVNAQTVIRSDYSSTPTRVETVKESNNDYETFYSMQFVFLTFDGGNNYGMAVSWYTPNGIGVDWLTRASFKTYGNYNVDLAANYTFPLAQNDDLSLFLTASIGPSFRMQDEFDFQKDKDKTKFYIDGIINPRLLLKYQKFTLSAGYFYWAPQFKFSKKDGGMGGLSLSLGYDF
ncbi:MAG: hypothetical protein PUD47_06035 [Bacteroidales bacterium]|nr:hypothetical protein [Bacteroidales bacterium]